MAKTGDRPRRPQLRSLDYRRSRHDQEASGIVLTRQIYGKAPLIWRKIHPPLEQMPDYRDSGGSPGEIVMSRKSKYHQGPPPSALRADASPGGGGSGGPDQARGCRACNDEVTSCEAEFGVNVMCGCVDQAPTAAVAAFAALGFLMAPDLGLPADFTLVPSLRPRPIFTASSRRVAA